MRTADDDETAIPPPDASSMRFSDTTAPEALCTDTACPAAPITRFDSTDAAPASPDTAMAAP